MLQQLFIFAAPLPVSNVTAFAISSTKVNVSWIPPDSDIGNFIVSVTRMSNIIKTKYLSNEKTSVLVTGLDVGTLYNVSVQVFSSGIFSREVVAENIPTSKFDC